MLSIAYLASTTQPTETMLLFSLLYLNFYPHLIYLQHFPELITASLNLFLPSTFMTPNSLDSSPSYLDFILSVLDWIQIFLFHKCCNSSILCPGAFFPPQLPLPQCFSRYGLLTTYIRITQRHLLKIKATELYPHTFLIRICREGSGMCDFFFFYKLSVILMQANV